VVTTAILNDDALSLLLGDELPRRGRGDVAPRRLDVAERIVLGLDPDRHRDGDVTVALNVHLLLTGVAVALGAATAMFVRRLDVHGDDLDGVLLGLRRRRRREQWRRRGKRLDDRRRWRRKGF
jgi:hypothetical protein